MKQWNEKMAVLQEQGYDGKKLINAEKESNKLKDLTYLKSQVPGGPFSTADEVRSYISLALEENEKNKRLYVEVRYARVSSSTLKETASRFCLKWNGRNLTTQDYADNLIKCMDDTESNSPVEKHEKIGEPRKNCNTSIFGIVRSQILCRITY